MKQAFLPRSTRLPKRRYLVVLAATLLVAVGMVGVSFHPSVAYASGGGCGDFFFINQQTGYYLDVVNETPIHGASVDQCYNDGSPSEIWYLLGPASNGAYYVQNDNGGKYLDVAGASTANKASVIQWYFNGNANQQWWFYGIGNGVYYIQNVNSGKYLDVATSALGAQVIQDTYEGWLSQEWNLVPANLPCG